MTFVIRLTPKLAESQMIYLLRPILAIAFAAFAYFTFWTLCRFSGLEHQSLRKGRSGYFRLVGAWCVALVGYAFIAETSGTPFTWNWVVECILGGDWIFVCIASPVLALGESLLHRRRQITLTT